MMLSNHPQPDFERMRKVLLRQGEPDRVPFVELFADREIMSVLLDEQVVVALPHQRELQRIALRQNIRFWYETGYDYVGVGVTLDIPRKRIGAPDTAELPRDQRLWQDETTGLINSWQDFEAFPWPQPQDIDYFPLEFTSKHLPEGMKMIVHSPGGQLENIMWLMGYMPMAYTLADDPALVEAIAEKVGTIMVNIFSTAAELPGIGALWISDDLGFKTATMIAPEHLRRYVFPWHKKLADIAHSHNLPCLLHACGNLEQVMDDLIDDVGIDAKHSFEDAIQPVTEAKKLYGHRLALLGGIDVDFLCRATEDQVRAYTRRVIEACAPGGGWALGTGNSVTNYIPVRNYLAMLDEGRTVGRY